MRKVKTNKLRNNLKELKRKNQKFIDVVSNVPKENDKIKAYFVIDGKRYEAKTVDFKCK